MASIERIKPGQILHDYHRYKMGNTNMSTEGHWRVEVIEVDVENMRALCSWNGNPPKWLGEASIKKYKVKEKTKKQEGSFWR